MGGALLALVSLILAGIGLEAGLDGVQALRGGHPPGGSLRIDVDCYFFEAFDAGTSPCKTDPAVARIFAGELLLREGTFRGDMFSIDRPLEVEHAPWADLRVEILHANQTWVRHYYVPDGKHHEDSVRVVTQPASKYFDESPADPLTVNGVGGESPRGEAWALVGVALALGGVIGGLCALFMTRLLAAAVGPWLAMLAAAFIAPVTGSVLFIVLPALFQAFWVTLASDEFEGRPSMEATILLE
jgi:hypothetical protein